MMGPFYGSANLTVIIKPSPSATIVTNEHNFCQGVPWNWRKPPANPMLFTNGSNFTNIIGANSQTYDATQTGNFRVVVTNTTSGCSKNSSQIAVTVNPLPAATAGNDGRLLLRWTINLTSGPEDSSVRLDKRCHHHLPHRCRILPLHRPTPTTRAYTVTVEDGNGCVNTAQTTVLV